MPTKRILVTGVSRDLGARFARALAADDDHVVLGADVTPPRHDLGKSSFVRADIRNPTIGKVIAAHGVDTVVHMALVATPRSAGGRSSMKEINVIGTMQLLAACQQAETFRKLVVQSSVSVYGASFRDPVRFTEDLTPRVPPRTGFGKDSVEVESYVRGLARRRPDVAVTTLRLANLMGAGVDSNVTRYLSLPVVPRVLGFDARLQFLHPSDAVEALLLVTREEVPGTYNVAAPDLLTLSQALGPAGPTVGRRPAAPGPADRRRLPAGPAPRLLGRPDRRADLWSRAWTPAGSPPPPASPRPTPAASALEEFAASAPPGVLSAAGWTRPSPCSAGSSATPRRPAPEVGVTDAEVIQLGSRGPAGRGSRTARRPPLGGWPRSPPPRVRAGPGSVDPGRADGRRRGTRGPNRRTSTSRSRSRPRPHRRGGRRPSRSAP